MQSTLPGNRRRHPHKAHQVHPLTVRHIDSNWFSFSERKFLIFRLPIGLECGRTAAHRKQISCIRLWFRGADPYLLDCNKKWTACFLDSMLRGEVYYGMSYIFWEVWPKAFLFKFLESIILTFGKDDAQCDGKANTTVVTTGVVSRDGVFH